VPHAASIAEVLADLDVKPDSGLSEQTAHERRERDGPNLIQVARPPTLLTLFARQFMSAIVLLLVAAAVISLVAGDAKDAIVILAILIVNALIGAFQEGKAESALTALRDMTPAHARCRRDGTVRDLLAQDLVRGDIVLLRAGDIVPADGRLIEAVSLAVDESSLTGESVPVDKRPSDVCDPAAVPGDRFNMGFQGTAVTAGHGEMAVTGIGMGTEMGQIAASLATTAPPQTPLERQVASLTRFLTFLAVGAAGAVFVLGELRGEPLQEMFLVALSLAVAAVPEGLPAVVTIVLALGVQRMARRHAIVRRLAAVEALGSSTVICTDKTGTLTLGEMRVSTVVVGDRVLDMTDLGLLHESQPVEVGGVPGLHDLIAAGVLCNNAQLGAAAIGDPTERALLHLAHDLGIDGSELAADCLREGEFPFDSERKRMTTVHRGPEGVVAYVKGAPDMVLPLCSRWVTSDGVQMLDADDRARIQARLDALASTGLRMLALGCRTPVGDSAYEDGAGSTERAADLFETDLTLLGMVGLLDPPRPEVPAALAAAHAAGIRTIMVTGDHPITALAIGQRLGLGDGHVLTGVDLQQLDDAALTRAARDLSICARVAPKQKVDIVRALQADGEVVGMTGDGSNDAPALRLADIGVAMGQRGTAVAKEAAAIILADDNFATIVAAIEEGRVIYANLRKTILYLVSGNFGEVLTILLAMLAGLPLPFQAIQILWINLVTDALPAIGLAMEPAEPGAMDRPPRPRGESFLPRWIMPLIGVPGVLLAASSLLAFGIMLGRDPGDLATAQTTAFVTLILGHLGIGWSQRTTLASSLSLPFWTNPVLLASIALGVGSLLLLVYTEIGRSLFHTAPLSIECWMLALLLAPLPLLGAELTKLVIRRRVGRATRAN
jgi:P-type Ca2+ transporter type 2C